LDAQPALSLLLIVGLIQFWLMPAIAWVLLEGQRDTAAKFWFAGTSCYAMTASLFVVQTLLPKGVFTLVGLVLVTLMLALIAESMRRELRSGPTPWRWIVAVVAGNVLLLMAVERTSGPDMMRAVQLGVVSILDIGCCLLLLAVIRIRRSRALLFVLGAFVMVIVTNVLRIHGYLVRGEPPVLLTYTWTSNLAFIANYLSVVIYSFGYWGFVIEKNRLALRAEGAERERAQQAESQAIDRERLSVELARQREELIGQLALMQRAAQAGALSASIAHEINQPLTSVRLSIDEAIELDRTGSNPDRLRTLLERAGQENHRAAVIIRRLRDMFAREQSEPETRSIDEVVRAMCALLQRRATDLNVSFQTRLNAPVQVRIGTGELEHVVLNLVTNALDALAAARTQEPRILVSTTVSDGHAVLSVTDNGPGIDESVRDRLFDLFSGSRRGGLGLGLWLSRHIVERHGGSIELQPSADVPGAAFRVRLSLA